MNTRPPAPVTNLSFDLCVCCLSIRHSKYPVRWTASSKSSFLYQGSRAYHTSPKPPLGLAVIVLVFFRHAPSRRLVDVSFNQQFESTWNIDITQWILYYSRPIYSGGESVVYYIRFSKQYFADILTEAIAIVTRLTRVSTSRTTRAWYLPLPPDFFTSTYEAPHLLHDFDILSISIERDSIYVPQPSLLALRPIKVCNVVSSSSSMADSTAARPTTQRQRRCRRGWSINQTDETYVSFLNAEVLGIYTKHLISQSKYCTPSTIRTRPIAFPEVTMYSKSRPSLWTRLLR